MQPVELPAGVRVYMCESTTPSSESHYYSQTIKILYTYISDAAMGT